MTADQKQIVKDAAVIGAVGTAVSIPLMLWLVPKEHQGTLSALGLSVILTAAGLATKLIYFKVANSHHA
ncbi:MAG: hypothetical protein ABFR47_08310 [Verrucomicrobiota bacterium]